MRLVFEVAGDKLIERELLRFGEYAQNATPAFEAIGGLMMDETGRQFDTEGAHASGGWAPLAQSTIRRREHRGYVPIVILHQTGALKRSLTERDAPHQIFNAGPQELVFGSRLPYAVYHQRGTPAMPRRRPLEFTEPAKRQMVKIIQRYIVTGEVAA